MEDTDSWPADAIYKVGVLNGEIVDLQQQLAERDARIAELEANAKAFQSIIKERDELLAERDARIVELDDELTTYKEEYTRKVFELSPAKATIMSQAAQIGTLAGAYLELEGQLDERDQQLAAAQSTIDQQVLDILSLIVEAINRGQQLAERNARIVELDGQLAERDARIAELTNQLAADQVAEAPSDNFAFEMLRIIR